MLERLVSLEISSEVGGSRAVAIGPLSRRAGKVSWMWTDDLDVVAGERSDGFVGGARGEFEQPLESSGRVEQQHSRRRRLDRECLRQVARKEDERAWLTTIVVLADVEGDLTVEETFDTREQAQAAWTAAETLAAMEADGIDMSSVWVDYFDEVDSGEPAHQ